MMKRTYKKPQLDVKGTIESLTVATSGSLSDPEHQGCYESPRVAAIAGNLRKRSMCPGNTPHCILGFEKALLIATL